MGTKQPKTKPASERKGPEGPPVITHAIKLFGAMALFYSAEMLNAANINYIYHKFSAKKRVVTKERVTTVQAALNPIVSIANKMIKNKEEDQKFQELASKHDHVFNEIAAGEVFKNLDKYEKALLKNPNNETVKKIFDDVWNTILSETEIKRLNTSMLLFIPNEEGTGGEMEDFLNDVKVTQKRNKVDTQFIWDLFPHTAAAKEYLVLALIAYAGMVKGEKEEYEKFSSNVHKFLCGIREDLKSNEEKISRNPSIEKITQIIMQKIISLDKMKSSRDMTEAEAQKVDEAGDKFWAEVIKAWNESIHEGSKVGGHFTLDGEDVEALRIRTPAQIQFDTRTGQIMLNSSSKEPEGGHSNPTQESKNRAMAGKRKEFEGFVFQYKAKYGLRVVPPTPTSNIQTTVKKREEIKDKQADIAFIKAQKAEIHDNLNRTFMTKGAQRYDILVLTLFNSLLADVSQVMSENKDEKGAGSIEKLKLSAKAQNVDVVKTVEKAIEQSGN